MFSFELSAFDVVLSVGVVVLIVLFVATIIKLNPSSEGKESKNENSHEKEHELAAPPHEPDQLAGTNMPSTAVRGADRISSEKPQQPPQITVSATPGGSSQESVEQAPKASGYRESPRNHKPQEVQKPTPKDFEQKDCFHFFGYLAGLPKNTPIPGECFGCQKIVDCLITLKKKR